MIAWAVFADRGPQMKKLLFAAIASAIFAPPTFAADLPVKAPPAPVAALYNWSGFYIGGDAGYFWGRTHEQNVGAAVLDAYPEPSGFSGGVHAGYRHQFASIVLGVEADWDWLGSNTAAATYSLGFPADARIKFNDSNSVRGIAGYAIDRSLLYITGGASWLRYKGCESDFGHTATCFPGIPEQSTNALGWTLGGGYAYGFTNNLVGRIEYLYADYGTKSLASPGFGNGITTYEVKTHTVRVGLSWKFGPF